jgi:hypothetical protein
MAHSLVAHGSRSGLAAAGQRMRPGGGLYSRQFRPVFTTIPLGYIE